VLFVLSLSASRKATQIKMQKKSEKSEKLLLVTYVTNFYCFETYSLRLLKRTAVSFADTDATLVSINP
jgi:hypothetical protein